jgi:D-alanyl-D-alanine carboxypeptidase
LRPHCSRRPGSNWPERFRLENDIEIVDAVRQYADSKVPGLQYLVTDAGGSLFECAGGWADIRNRREMALDTTLMAYSMTKTFTAVAILQLAEQGKLGLDDLIDSYVPQTPYNGRRIAIRQLLDHTSGIPNPIPLRWAHLANEAATFNEDATLATILRENPKLKFEPGRRFAYSNIGYWLLGKIIERITGQSYSDFATESILRPIDPSGLELDFAIQDPARHAKGYLAKYSLMNLLKGLVTDRRFWGGYEGNWLQLKSHYLNGPAFGGLVGSARGFGRFLQDQLRDHSVLFSADSKRLLETQQADRAGRPIPMTLGWHIGKANGLTYFFKEGGGGGFHSEMRIYSAKSVASVVMTNATQFNSTRFLNHFDPMVV